MSPLFSTRRQYSDWAAQLHIPQFAGLQPLPHWSDGTFLLLFALGMRSGAMACD